MKRRAFIKASLPVAAGAIATGALSGEILDPIEETDMARIHKAMEEIKDILRKAAPDGAELQGITWGGPFGRETIGAWANMDGVQFNFHAIPSTKDVVFS